MQLVLKCKLLTPTAKLPTRGSAQAAGLDLYADLTVEDLLLDVGCTRRVATNVAIELPEGYEAQVRPRSGCSSKGLLVHFGTVDSDYRGGIDVTLTNVGRYELTIQRGDRIAQLVIAPVLRMDPIECDELSETERGVNGYGSTGR